MTQALSMRARAHVDDAILAVESSDTPVSPEAFEALADVNLRQVVERDLNAIGRTLVEVRGGYLSGYHDAVIEEVHGTNQRSLDPEEAAVLTAVLLLSYCIPRAKGDLESEHWTDAIPVARDDVEKQTRLSAAAVSRALKTLRARGVLARGTRTNPAPGPQFDRLTPAQSRELYLRLVALADPDGIAALDLGHLGVGDG